MIISRRGALTGIGAITTVASAALAGPTPAVQFDHGIASGEPRRDGALLWTRITTDGDDVPLRWHVADGPDGAPVASGDVVARGSRDHCVKAEISGLRPGRDYWYWFESPTQRSSVGRFRTLPIGRIEDLVVAAVSCQLYQGGFFNAYETIARRDRLDAVIHLGDYIYETDAEGTGRDIARKLGRVVDPPRPPVTLDDYRRRHAQVKRDRDLQAAHARAAFICVWDDHDAANDDWVGGAQGHDPATQGRWSDRKRAAMQAWFDWMPVRDPPPDAPSAAIYRSFEFGDLATLVMIETRLLARSQKVTPGKTPDYAALLAERADPRREMLGDAQQRWLEQTLAASVRADRPWQVIGNEVVMAAVKGPDLERQLAPDRYAAMIAALPPGWSAEVASMVAGYRAGMPFDLDSWDGYPAARERFYAACRRAGSRPIVLSGDSHAAWANLLVDDAGRRIGNEFGATAITSPSYGSLIPGIGNLIADANDNVEFCDEDSKGYLILTLTHDEAVVDLVALSTVIAKPFTERSTRFRVGARDHRMTRDTA